MSGPVFIQDARGVPLMPTAAPYARKLLCQSKAIRVPHHTFTVLRLAKPVVAPTLRPVLLDVTCLGLSLVLTLIVQHVSFACLLTVLAGIAPRSPLQPLHRRERHILTLRSPLLHLSSKQGSRHLSSTTHEVSIDALADVVLALRTLIPISHLRLPAAPVTSHAYTDIQRLCDHPVCAGLDLIDADQAHSLFHTTRCWPARESTVSISIAPTVIAWSQHDGRGNSRYAPVQGMFARGAPTGLTYTGRSRNRKLVLLPYLTPTDAIRWQQLAVRRSGLRTLEHERVVFLPVSALPRARAGSGER